MDDKTKILKLENILFMIEDIIYDEERDAYDKIGYINDIILPQFYMLIF